MNVVIVSGYRRWTDVGAVEERLAIYRSREGTMMILHGNAPGADSIAAAIGRMWGVVTVPVPYFSFLGKEGGPMRNRVLALIGQTMRRNGDDVYVEAFVHPTLSRGTKDMLRWAADAGLWFHITEAREG